MRFVYANFLAAFLLAAVLSAGSVAERSGARSAPTLDNSERLLKSASESGKQSASQALVLPPRTTVGATITNLPNGDFESGATVWSEASLNGWNLILQYTELPQGVLPHGGNWATWLGGDVDEISYIQQQVTVPVGSPVLKYWHWIDSEDDCGYDVAGVVINTSTVVQVYDLCWQVDTGGWVLHSVDMAAYAGETVNLQIRVETDDQLISNLYVDDVFFESDADLIFSDGFESGDTGAW